MAEIAFGFDLHNTLMLSNEAWIKAYLSLSDNKYREYIEKAVYQKQSRELIAKKIGVNYNSVYDKYCSYVKPSNEYLKLLSTLKKKHPICLISSASYNRVIKDLSIWDGTCFFDIILTKETFDKSNYFDWKSLMDRQNYDLLVYIGNDPEEDVIDYPKVISLISGEFLNKLNSLNLLIKRSEEKND